MSDPTETVAQMDAAGLYSASRRYLGAIAHRVGHRYRVDPDDLLSELCVQLLLAAHRYDPARGKAEAFAALTVRPALASLRRRRSVAAVTLTGDGEGGGVLDHLAGAEADPADAAEVGEQAARAVAALAALPERQRRAVELRFGLDGGGGGTVREVGAALGVSGASAGQLVDRGLARLRAELGGQPG